MLHRRKGTRPTFLGDRGEAELTMSRKQKMKLLHIFLVLLLFSGAAFSLTAFADYQDGFEQYPTGSSSPLIIPPNNQGWVFSNGGCGALLNYVVNQYNGLQPYQGNAMDAMYSLSPCTSLGTLSINLIATSSTVSIAFEGRENSSMLALKLIFYGVTWAYSTTANSWVKLSATVGAQKGSLYSLQLGCQFPQGSGSEGACFFDSVNVTGAALWNYPTDFQMVDWIGKPTLYNLVGYGGTSSTVSVNYTGSGSFTAGNLTAPDLCLPIIVGGSGCQSAPSAPKLVTVWVGSRYFRTIIPKATGNTTMYLDPPSQVLPYQITLEDPTGTFLPGSTIEIQSQGLNITTGYLDGQYSFATWLVPGTYTVTVVMGLSRFSSLLNLGSNPNIVVQYSQPPGGISPGAISSVSYSAYWACSNNAVIGNYADSSSGTSSLNMILYNQTSSGLKVLYNQSFSGPIGTVQASFGNIVPALGTYEVAFQPVLSLGKQYFGPIQLTPTNPSCPGSFPSIIPSLPNFPIAIFGLNQLLPNANAYSEIIALVIIVLTIAVFGARFAPLGFIVVGFEVMWFFLALFIPSSWTLVYLFVVTSVIGFLKFKQRRP
jgi:hypothetical protein